MFQKATVLTVTLLVFFLAGTAEAQRILNANITARLIQAKEEAPEELDPALADIESKLKSFFKYKQYKQLASETGLAASGATWKARFPGNLVLEATFLGANEGQMEWKLRWTLRRPEERPLEYFNTRVKIMQGETFVMAGPPSDGGVLLLAVTTE